MTEERNSEAKFASRDGDNTGIGYYDNDGTELTPEEFRRRVAEDAAKAARTEGEAGRRGRGGSDA